MNVSKRDHRSKGRFVDGVVESGWLVALIVGPLYFNDLTSRIFEPDKIIVIQLVGLTVLLALIGRLNATRPSLPKDWSRIGPIAAGVAIVVVAAILSTVTSIAPRISLLGSFARMQGLLFLGACITLFVGTAGSLKTRDQLDRLFAAAILASIPVSLYGIAQAVGLDPLTWDWDVEHRATTTLGNPVFAAGYLAMTIPLTLAYALTSSGGPRRIVALLAAGFQFSCVWMTQSRGAVIALALGLFVFGMLFLLSTGRKRAAKTTVIASVALVALLWMIQKPAGQPASDLLGGHRITRVLNTESGSGRVRVLIWTGVERVILSNPIRTLIGYGPDTIRYTLPAKTPAEIESLHPGARTDRAHNDTYDIVLTTGLAGLTGWLLVVTTLLLMSLRFLGIDRRRSDSWRFFAFWIGGGLAGALLAAVIDDSLKTVGPAFSLGLIAGLCAYLSIRAFLKRSSAEVEPRTAAILIGLASAVTVHFAEIQVGIAIAATRSLFWIAAGAMTAIIWRGCLAAGSRDSRNDAGWGAICGLVVATVACGLILSSRPLATPLLGLGLVVLTWVAAACMRASRTDPDDSGSAFWTWSGLVSAGLVALRMLSLELDRTLNVAAAIYPAAAIGIVLLAAYAVNGPPTRGTELSTASLTAWQGWQRRLGWSLFTVILIAGWLESVSWIRADTALHQSRQAASRGAEKQAIGEGTKAINRDPDRPVYFMNLGRAYMTAGEFRRAEALLRVAAARNPLDDDHPANLGRLYLHWWKADPNAPGSNRFANNAIDEFKQAIELHPNSASLYYELGVASLVSRDTAAAISAFERSETLNPRMVASTIQLGQIRAALGRREESR